MKRVWQAVAGVVVGLVLVEAAFYLRDGGAFPHIHAYLPDPILGLRLEPGATQRISFSGNPVTSVRINAQGLRGADLPPPRPGEVVVVGDSQVFGLGVEEHETFSARLAERTGRPVVNAGVPTYGPPEYAELARRLVVERKPATVVFTINMVNDLFEWNAPNVERHAEWDGWAVRTETAPASTLDFPGRRLLMRKSHAVFALRTLIAGNKPNPEGAVGFPSEGTWTDLVQPEHLTSMSQADPTDLPEPPPLDEALEEVQRALSEAAMDGQQQALGRHTTDGSILLEAVSGHPGDIVGPRYAEESRAVPVTARLMRQGARYRDRVVEKLAAQDNERAQAIQSAQRRGEALEEQRQAEASRLLNRRVPLSVLQPELEALRDFCDEHGVELVVVVLPVDVQVSEAEWEKYEGLPPVDMAPSLVLIDDIIADAKSLGVRAVDTLPALRAAEPGAFLYGDIHMTPKGHAAVADALADALSKPSPVRPPKPGLPDGTSWLPRQQDWLRTPEALVRGSSHARCETVRIREWLRVTCLRIDGRQPTGATVRSGDRGEARVVRSDEAVTLVTPLFEGEDLHAVMHWETYGQPLLGKWNSTGGIDFALGDRDPSLAAPPTITPAEARLCGCYKGIREEVSCDWQGDPLDPSSTDFVTSWVGDCTASCAQMSGGNVEVCGAMHPGSCEAFLACAEGRVGYGPDCPEGTAAVGGGGVCLPLCSPDVPCADGSACRPWQGTGVCG